MWWIVVNKKWVPSSLLFLQREGCVKLECWCWFVPYSSFKKSWEVFGKRSRWWWWLWEWLTEWMWMTGVEILRWCFFFLLLFSVSYFLLLNNRWWETNRNLRWEFSFFSLLSSVISSHPVYTSLGWYGWCQFLPLLFPFNFWLLGIKEKMMGWDEYLRWRWYEMMK